MTDNLIIQNDKQLAEQINTEHKAVIDGLRASLDHAIKAGELLLDAKRIAGHGNWLEWLHTNCQFSERTAQNYIKLAENKERLSNTQRVADLSLREAVALLTDSKLDKIEQLEFEYSLSEKKPEPITTADIIKQQFRDRGNIPNHNPYPEEWSDLKEIKYPVEMSVLAIDEIIRLDKFDSRDKRDASITVWYASIFETLPPIGVYMIDGSYYLVDGFYRFDAAKYLNLTEIYCRIYEGDIHCALLYSIQSNIMNGFGLTQEDILYNYHRRERMLAEIEVNYDRS